MQDLDLDELDQAVTQIMEPKAKKPAASVGLNMPDSPKPSVPMLAKPAPQPETVAVNTSVVRPLTRPAPRKRMRPGAMDIIQRPVPTSAPSRRPNREAVALQPTKPIAPEPSLPNPAPKATFAPPPPTEEVSDDLLASINLLEDANKTVKPKVEQQPVPAAETWPDPIDLHNFNEPPAPTTPELQAEPAPTPTDEPPTMHTASPAPVEPAVSPFLTTKVEKRPLGAYAASVTEPEPQEAPPETSAPQQETSSPETTEALLPVAEPQPELDDPRQMAIPQQYHTTQPAPNGVVRNVFDTKEYHAPPQPMHAARRSGPGLVIGVVVLIVLVVAVAAIGYLMMTGVLDMRKIW